MKTYKDLPASKQEKLKKFPAYVSLLAATYHNKGMDKEEMTAAIEFTHVKSFRHEPGLAEFYADVEKDFEQTLILLNNQLPKERKAREEAIKIELSAIEEIVSELDAEYSNAVHATMNSYKEHVAHSHQSLWEYLIFPIPIKGLTY